MRTVFAMLFVLLLFSSCRFYREQEPAYTRKWISWPRNSTERKNLSREKDWYDNGRLSEKHLSFDRSGCWSQTTYIERGKVYFSNGRIQRRYHSRGKRAVVREYYVTGGLKRKMRTQKIEYPESRRMQILEDTSQIYHTGVYLARIKTRDSLSGRVIRVTDRDSLIIRAKF